MTWRYGDKYQGDWKNNKWDGRGIVLYADGSHYNAWLNGEHFGAKYYKGDCKNDK